MCQLEFFAGHLIAKSGHVKKVFSVNVIVVTLLFPTASNYPGNRSAIALHHLNF